ncbi:DVUA0089 family protein [Colwellia psychrerythraea]|nr:DVUA0089 family protein [Colwellia psychrerythraea]
MKNFKAIIAGLVLSVSSFANAGLISDITGNGSIANALDIDGAFSLGANIDIANSEITPWASISSGVESAARYDYYSFTAMAGMNGIFDIDYGRNAGGSFDPEIVLFDLSGTVLAEDDDSSTSDGAAGSVHGYDSFLSHNFAASGTYIIGVCQFSCGGQQGGMTGNLIPAAGTYQLQVSIENHDIPEPSTIAILALGIMGLTARKLKKQ